MTDIPQATPDNSWTALCEFLYELAEKQDENERILTIEDKNKTRAECDIMLVNGKTVAIIEVKYFDENIKTF